MFFSRGLSDDRAGGQGAQIGEGDAHSQGVQGGFDINNNDNNNGNNNSINNNYNNAINNCNNNNKGGLQKNIARGTTDPAY